MRFSQLSISAILRLGYQQHLPFLQVKLKVVHIILEVYVIEGRIHASYN